MVHFQNVQSLQLATARLTAAKGWRKAEYRYRYSKDGWERELRFKLFSMTGGEKSAIMVYHGFPRTGGSMEREFAAIYADLVRK